MDSTKRLYFDDPGGSPFDAVVVGHGLHQDRPSVFLDRTGFYPESGGQMADHGVLSVRTGEPTPSGRLPAGDRAVVDVQVDDAGRIHHVLEPGPLPGVGAAVEGVPDHGRRRLHQSLHTGQHMLSRALLEAAGAETISSRLGETACTIDTPTERVREGDLARAEALTNAVVDEDVPVDAFFPTPEALAALPLRRRPKVAENVRVVRVGDFDCSPCGGTHCVRSAQVGLVRVEGIERYKGGQRITFSAGARARIAVFAAHEALSALARGLTCGLGDVALAVDRLRRELAVSRDAEARMQERLADALAARLLDAVGPAPRLVLAFPGEEQAFLRALARRLTVVAGAVALLAAPGPAGTRVMAARGPGATFDCGAFVKRAAARLGGRGGGRPESAEGLLPALTEPWGRVVAELEVLTP